MQTEHKLLDEPIEHGLLDEPTEQELLKQLEEIKIKKQKQLEILKLKEKETEFNRQQQFIMEKIRGYLKIDITNEEISSLVNECNISNYEHHSIKYYGMKYYFKVSGDDDLLIYKKLLNKFARHHNIRYDDSYEIILRYLNKIQPLNGYQEYCNEYIILYQKHQSNEINRRQLDRNYIQHSFIDQTEYSKRYIPIFIK
jgi:hypothetical protein